MSARPRAVLVCPGGATTGALALRSLPEGHPAVEAADGIRTEYGLEPLRDLDRAAAIDPERHLRPASSGPLIFLRTLLDAERVADDLDLVAVVGSSIGWFGALAVSGALPFADAFRLVQEVTLLREQAGLAGAGGQVIYPLLDEQWRLSPEQRAAIADVLADDGVAGQRVFESIDFGSFVVMAADEAGVERLLKRLPTIQRGTRRFPLRLALQGPDHSPLADEVAETVAERLASLGWQRPQIPLVDGRGARWSPWSTDPADLRDYSLGRQLTEPYRFATGLRVALREYAPDHLVLAGPGGALASILGQLLVAEGYRGVRTRAAFEAAQRSSTPLLLSMSRPAA